MSLNMNTQCYDNVILWSLNITGTVRSSILQTSILVLRSKGKFRLVPRILFCYSTLSCGWEKLAVILLLQYPVPIIHPWRGVKKTVWFLSECRNAGNLCSKRHTSIKFLQWVLLCVAAQEGREIKYKEPEMSWWK